MFFNQRLFPLKLQLLVAVLLITGIVVIGSSYISDQRQYVAQLGDQQDADRWLHYLLQQQAARDRASAKHFWQQTPQQASDLPSPLLLVQWIADNTALPRLQHEEMFDVDMINDMLRQLQPRSGIQMRISCQRRCLLLQTISLHQQQSTGRLLLISPLDETLAQLSLQMQAPLFFVGALPYAENNQPDWASLSMNSVWSSLNATAVGDKLKHALQGLDPRPLRTLGDLIGLLEQSVLEERHPVLVNMAPEEQPEEQFLMLFLPASASGGLWHAGGIDGKLMALALLCLLLLCWIMVLVKRVLGFRRELLALEPMVQGDPHPQLDEISDLHTLSCRLHHQLDEQKRQLEKQRHLLEQRNLHDALTGLPNRDCFIFEVRRQIASLQRHPDQLALILLEVRGMRQRLVQPGDGERQLQQVAEVLRNTMRESDLLCYLQGNMFAILLTHLQDKDQLHLVMSKLQERLDHAIRLGNYPQTLHFAAGIVHVDNDSCDATELLRQAELALNEVARQDEQYYQLFNPMLQQKSVRTQFIEQRFPLSLRNGELQLQFQPIMATDTGRWTMIEALCRWQIPLEGPIAPSEFMPILDASRQGRELSHWVIERSLNQLRQLDSAGLAGLQLAINLSGHQLLDPDLLSVLEKLTLTYHIIPGRVAIEVNEQALRVDYVAGQNALRRLHQAGFRLTLDDFGTGYSALTYLSRSPFDLIKLDGSFTDKMLDSEIDRQMVSSIIRMSHSMGKRVIGEGIESSQQASLLQEYGCDRLQGNLLMAPVGECDLRSQLTTPSLTQLQQLGLATPSHKR